MTRRRARDYTPRVRREREREPLKNTPRHLAGSQRASARCWLSGELVQALSKVERYWRPGFDEPSSSEERGHVSSVKLFGPGRVPPEELPDFYTLRYKSRATILGAESGMFVLKSHRLVMRDTQFLVAVAHLRADGLCCQSCAESPGYMFQEHTRLPNGEPCHFHTLMRSPSPLHIWVTQARMVVKAAGVPDEHTQIALSLFERATAYPIDGD